jgi:hypothetical protein
MSYITSRHRNLSNYQGSHEVLNNPESYFGPNYRTLINYWIYCDIKNIDPLHHYWDIEDTSSASYEYIDFVSGFMSDGALIEHDFLTGIELEIIKCHLFIESSYPLFYIPQI